MDMFHYLDDSELESLVAECESETAQLPRRVKSSVLASVHREELRMGRSVQKSQVRWMDSTLAHNLRVASVMVACIALLVFLPTGSADGDLEKECSLSYRGAEQHTYKSDWNGFFDQGVLFTKESNVLFRQGRNQIFVREDVTK